MCGIAGFTGQASPGVLDSMLEVQRHRGPDEHDFLTDRAVHLAHTRLAIIDLQSGRQPMWNEDRTVAIVFNGEIYNYRELRSRLEPRHRFQTSSDTEVILHLYEEQGLETPHQLDGDFAFCIWDARKQQCFLCRDPLGVKPLFYAQTRSGDLVFGSELTAIVRHPEIHPEIDLQAVTEYLTCLSIAAPRTLLRDIHKLKPGEALLWNNGSLRSWFWWRIPEVENRTIATEDFRDRVREALVKSVQKRLIADVPVGAFLSGGLDSGLIVALAAQVSPGIQTFSVGFGEPDFDELRPARELSQWFGTVHHEFVLRPDRAELLEEVINAMDEPIADSSAIPTFLISRETQRTVKVALSGVGGDEMFGGYPRYLGAKLSHELPSWSAAPISLATRWAASRPDGRDLRGWLYRFQKGLRKTPEDRYWYWTTYLDDPLRHDLLRYESRESVFETEALQQLRMEGPEYLDRIFRLDVVRYLGANLLKFADNMSMANSLELRVPYCDLRLLEEVARTRASIRHPGYQLKPVLKDIAVRFLPREFVRRKKQGFMIPIGRWFRQDLRKQLEHELLGEEVPVFLKAQTVRRLVQEHVNFKANHTHVLWALWVLKRWLVKHPEIKITGEQPI